MNVKRLEQLLEPTIRGLGYELVGIESISEGSRKILRIYIDSLATGQGVGLDDCSTVSRQIDAVLAVEGFDVGRYYLEVSSPGMDRMLFKPEHYARFTGCEIKLRLLEPLEGKGAFRGLLKEAHNDHVVMKCGDDELNFPFSAIAKARLVPDFDNLPRRDREAS